MPKKYRQKSLLIKPGSSAASSKPQSHHESSTPSVNERIAESRRAQLNREPREAPTTAGSIPPALRAVLDLPAPPPPRPRIGARNAGPSRLRRIPGPPPPKSWLTDSAHAPAEVQNTYGGTKSVTRLQSRQSNLPEGHFPAARSLQHLALKHMATNWEWHAEYDHEYLPSLPTPMKETLISYIGIYNETPRVNPLRVLFITGTDEEACDEVRRLDISNGLGNWTTLKQLQKDLRNDAKSSQTHSEENEPSTADTGPKTRAVPEAWDDDLEEDADESATAPLAGALRGPLFRNLRHLSLAISPGNPSISWPSLLNLAPDISTIQSLSLAYWPQPSFTPNAAATRVLVKNPVSNGLPGVVYGGSDMYNAFDDNWREAAGILRTLSRILYCLKWLDLTGCGAWWHALTWAGRTHETVEEDQSPRFGPEWNSGWRGVEHIVMAVGWTPLEPHLTHAALPPRAEVPEKKTPDIYTPPARVAESLSRISLGRLSNQSAEDTADCDAPEARIQTWNVEVERREHYYRKEVERHRDSERTARQVAMELRTVRRLASGKWIDFEFGDSLAPLDHIV